MDKKISIIVPAYNAEKYLERCVDSMANQNLPYDDYEVIVINDGSTDGTSSLLNDLHFKYPFLRYIKTTNGGLSRARNRGIREAVGEYLLFVDSDDSIAPHMLKRIYEELVRRDLDMLLMDYSYLAVDGSPLKKPLNISNVTSQVVSGKKFLLNQKYYPMVWAYAYRRDFLLNNKLEMIPIWHEDEEFTPRAIFMAQRIIYLPLVFYNYFRNNGSFMMRYDEKSCFDMILGMESLEWFRKKYVIEDDLNFYFRDLIAKNLLKSFKRSVYWGAAVSIQKKMIEEMKKRNLAPVPCGKGSFYFWMYKYAPFIFVYYYRLKLKRYNTRNNVRD